MKTLPILFTLFLMLIAQPAFSIDLQTAKTQGLVGETANGYLQPVITPSPAIKSLISSVNAQRKSKYQEIASRNKTSLQAVEKLAGRKAIEKTKTGGYIKQSGSWRKK